MYSSIVLAVRSGRDDLTRAPLLQKLDEKEQEAHRVAQENLLSQQLAKLRDDKLRDEQER